jgi:hypothetical protein
MGDRPIFLKTSAPHPLMTTFQKNLLSARSLSLDSTFKEKFTLGPGAVHGSDYGVTLCDEDNVGKKCTATRWGIFFNKNNIIIYKFLTSKSLLYTQMILLYFYPENLAFLVTFINKKMADIKSIICEELKGMT